MNPHADSRMGRATTRRRWMQLCTGATVVALAGCTGGDDDGDGGDAGGNGVAGGDDSPGDDGTGGGGDDGTGDGGDDDGSTGGESIQLEAADGWKVPHDGVEIPDEPGSAILKIGGERVVLTSFLAHVSEEPGGMGVTGAETFEAQITYRGQYREEEISVDVRRIIGYEDTAGTWAESDSVTFTRTRDSRRLGNIIYRLFEDGRLADAESAGDLEGRRFVDEPFVHVSQDGVVTMVEEISSHEDDSLDGEFEFGGRLPEGWDQQ